MDGHLHCSVIGTCLSTTDLRKLMAKVIHVQGLSGLDVSRALHKALGRRHDAAVQRVTKARGAAALGDLWQQAIESGEVPGAYWALLTHRRTTPELRQRVFGDVHMLLHLVGAANRADIRRLVALERENADLRERAERQQDRLAEITAERDHERSARAATERPQAPTAAADVAQAIALQTRRRDDAENRARALAADAQRWQSELQALRGHLAELTRELAAAEGELRSHSADPQGAASVLTVALSGHRLLYVGGRPSSSAAIRDLVLRHGADFQRHDGGIEDRKGLLAAALSGATLVVFPVDCIDHDSALSLKRSCQRLSVPILALRSASVASFAAAVEAWARPGAQPACGCGHPCLKRG